ncbi:MAG: hypothetical protein QF886_20010, partial [Planctomycetota bacterium]|nr:hypothetical protein [Planctomycetota bacterium]
LFILGAKDLARWTARPIGYAYRNRLHGHGARMFAMAWGAPGAHLAPGSEFNLYMNNLIWHYELILRRDGSMQALAPMGSTSRLGMAHALPKQKLRVFGAPKGTFGSLPPANLSGLAEFFKQKKWKELAKSFEHTKPANDSERKYITGLKAAYQRTEQHYQASLALIEGNIRAGNEWRAKQQLDALVTFIGEERDAMKKLSARIKNPDKPKARRAKRNEPAPTKPKVHLWDIMLEGGDAAKDEHYVYGTDADHPAPQGWADFDYNPKGWSSVVESEGKVPSARTLLVRREFNRSKGDDLPDDFLDADPDAADDDAALLDTAEEKPSKKAAYTAMCLAIDPAVSGDIFLNGVRIVSFTKGDGPRRFDLGQKALSLLRPARNILAAKLVGCGTSTRRLARLGLGPAGARGVEVRAKEPFEESGGGRNGWRPPAERFHEDCREFFKDKSARECARFLTHPVFTVIEEAAAAITRDGNAGLPLVKELVQDTHPGIRMGGWDVALALQKAGKLDDNAVEELLTLAAQSLSDARVMQSTA